jgi:hypothetical protein
MHYQRIVGLSKTIALVTFFAAFWGGVGASQQADTRMNKTAETSAPLTLVISNSKERVSQSEPFVLEVKLVNVSKEKVSIFGRLLWGYAGGLTLHVSDQSGREVYAEEHDDDMVIPSVLDNPEAYVVLLPHHFLGIERKDSPKNLFRNPGSYSVVAEYQSPVPAHYAKTPNFFGRENGVIRSAAIHIQVMKE